MHDACTKTGSMAIWTVDSVLAYAVEQEAHKAAAARAPWQAANSRRKLSTLLTRNITYCSDTTIEFPPENISVLQTRQIWAKLVDSLGYGLWVLRSI